MLTSSYPESPRARTEWILSQRGPRHRVNPARPYAFLVEEERAESGEVLPGAAIFLTNKECPWRCLMCDLWRNTLEERTAPGAIPSQIDYALEQLKSSSGLSPGEGGLRQIKLYNSGSFFDPGAVPAGDYEAIAGRMKSFERVVVESHPGFLGPRALEFQNLIPGRLEVAIGLETAHPDVLARLNKGMTLEDFRRAANFLAKNDFALRVFVLVNPPFLPKEEAVEWAVRSATLAFDCGATAVSLIPTRHGNGALEILAAEGAFAPPGLPLFEEAVAESLSLKRGRIFADLWDLEKFSNCQACFQAREERLRQMNFQQEAFPAIECGRCAPSYP
jgi:archaeosine synthase beta-subunit